MSKELESVSMLSRRSTGIFLACVLTAGAAALASSHEYEPGTFALFDGTQQTSADFWQKPPTGLTTSLKVRQRQGATTITDYNVDFGHAMHFFIIRDDFATFQHYAADVDLTTGTFSHTFTKEPGHRYYLYTDSHPRSMHRQAYRFTVPSAGAAAPVSPSLTASPTNVAAGPYTVIFSKTTLTAGQPYLLLVTVDRGGKGADDLTPIFGGAAQMTVVNVSTLQYVFTHPTLRGQKLNKGETYNLDQHLGQLAENSQVGPNQQVELPALPAGTYKAWYQFVGGISQDKYVAPFTLVVQ